MTKKITVAEIKIDGFPQTIGDRITLGDTLLRVTDTGAKMSERVEQMNANMQKLSETFDSAKQYTNFLSIAFENI